MLFFLFPLPLFITLFYILLAYIIVWLNIELCLRQGNIIIRTQTCHLVRNSFHKKYKITWYICTYVRCKNELGSWDSSTLFSFCSDFYLVYIILSHIRRESFAIYFVFIVSYIISLKKKKDHHSVCLKRKITVDVFSDSEHHCEIQSCAASICSVTICNFAHT